MQWISGGGCDGSHCASPSLRQCDLTVNACKRFSPGFSFLQDPTAAHYMFQDDPFLMPRNAANSVSIPIQILDGFPLPCLCSAWEKSNWGLLSVTKGNEVSGLVQSCLPCVFLNS